ncbi:MAG TPA: cysteine--tRNA ligase [Dehalococcoidia bacterium]|nr:cysteine--tRNA ligase [Dehalococcoidia bacterium]
MRLFNTLSGQKEEFYPKGETVTMYVCGVTAYDDCHIGHAMSYVIFDVIRRYLEFKGYKVKHVQNFTDIDDKIINRAQQLGIPAQELADKYNSEYFKDMDGLNIKRAHVYPKATEEIPKIVEVIQGLMTNGYAYESEGNVYFRVKSFPGYGKLAHQNLEEMMSKTCSEAGKKDYPLDFALWKAAKPGEPSWSSPWGEGRPGWHIECSAMALKYLGDSLDIHGGGQDLIFPHHENEIAQSESFTKVTPFAKYWLHNGLLQLGEDKMSKSLGNLITVKKALERYSPDAIRLFVLGSHYRSPLTYSEESLEAAETGMERLRQAIRNGGETGGKVALDSEPFRHRFIESMDDDFNTAQAIAVLFELVREINRAREENIDMAQAQHTLTELAKVLGFTLEEPAKPPLEAEPFIKLLISVRDDLRQAKEWQLADKIRSHLDELGITLEDTPKGTVWKRSR